VAWSIKSYNAYLRSAKREYGLTHEQAQRMYANHRDRVGHSLNSRELREHPRIAAKEARHAAGRVPPISGGRPAPAAPGGAAIAAAAAAGIPYEAIDEDSFYDGHQAEEENAY
jgi:siroheme synthase